MTKANESVFLARLVRWLPVRDWPQYEVSDCGEVRGWLIGGTRQQKRRLPRYKKLYYGKDGYARVTFHEKRKGCKTRVETFLVSRLVAITFIPTYDETLDVAHLDGNKKNNRVENLKWCTRKENESHKITHGTKAQGSRNGQSKLCERAVIAIRTLAKDEKWSQGKIAKLFQVSQKNVSAIVLGKSWRQI